jgi:hypothetical protein
VKLEEWIEGDYENQVGAGFGVSPLLFLFHICNDLAQLSSRRTANNQSCMF